MIKTTTNNIEGWEILKYHQPVTATIVIGSNIFSDISASFTDLFGGRSGIYEKKIKQLHEAAIQKLTDQAIKLNANAIIGIKIDIDEISGGGKSMFMISAIGTPVLVKKSGYSQSESSSKSDHTISGNRMQELVKKREILSSTKKLSLSSIEYISETGDSAFLEKMLDSIVDYSYEPYQSYDLAIKNYFNGLDIDSLKGVYEFILSDRCQKSKHIKMAKDILTETFSIDYNEIERILQSEKDIFIKKAVLELVKTYKPSYSDSDISALESLKKTIELSFPRVFEIKSVKSGLFSSSQSNIWQCVCGCKNDENAIKCNCGGDIYGFSSSEYSRRTAISDIDKLISIMNETFKSL